MSLLDVRVERNVAIPMRDGTTLRADVFRPEREGHYPVLLSRTPYDKSANATAYAWMNPVRPASNGYAVVNCVRAEKFCRVSWPMLTSIA